MSEQRGRTKTSILNRTQWMYLTINEFLIIPPTPTPHPQKKLIKSVLKQKHMLPRLEKDSGKSIG